MFKLGTLPKNANVSVGFGIALDLTEGASVKALDLRSQQARILSKLWT